MGRITYIATEKGIEKAEKALERLGFGSKQNFAKCIYVSRSSVTHFFNRSKGLQLDTFERICEELMLNWKEIAGIEEDQESFSSKKSNASSLIVKENIEQERQSSREIKVLDTNNQKIKAVITLQGNLDSVENKQIFETILKQYSGDTIQINDIKEGSIKLHIEGSQEDIQKLVSLIKNGELKELNSFPIENIQINKWDLVKRIIDKNLSLIEKRSLQGVDLSDADLSGAHLTAAHLSGAHLNFSDLSGAHLIGANLSFSNLIDADLRDADLRDAEVLETRFGNNLGMTQSLKEDLISRGAIFGEEDYSKKKILTPI